MYDLGARFKLVRKEKKLTQKQVADGIGVPERQYQYYEYGKNTPSALLLCALADYFNVPLDFLTGRSLFSKWDQINKHWDDVMNHLEDSGALLEMIRKLGDDRINIVYLLSVAVEDIAFQENPTEITIHFK